jgi:hypothetical protein
LTGFVEIGILLFMKTKTTFRQLYSFPGFRACGRFKSGVKGDPGARVVEIKRRQKKQSVPVVGAPIAIIMIAVCIGCAIWIPAKCGFTWNLSTGV